MDISQIKQQFPEGFQAVVDLMESFDQNTKITVHEIKSTKTFRKITRVEIEE